MIPVLVLQHFEGGMFLGLGGASRGIIGRFIKWHFRKASRFFGSFLSKS
jgi:hypothetical protein